MNTTNARTRKDGGFTIFELIAVLMLMGIVAALATPSMSEYMNRSKTRRALDRVTSEILMARMMAVRSGERAVLELSGPDRYRVWIEGAAPDTIKNVSLAADYPGVTLSAPGLPDGRLVFNARGLLQDAGSGLVIARLGRAADTLKITVAGRIYRAY